MSAPFWIASALFVGLALGRSVLGERYILQRIFRRADLPKLFGSDTFTKRTLRFAWHLTSVASSLVAAVGSRLRHVAWVAFVLAGAALWYGAAA